MKVRSATVRGLCRVPRFFLSKQNVKVPEFLQGESETDSDSDKNFSI